MRVGFRLALEAMFGILAFAVALALAFLEIRGRRYAKEPHWRAELRASVVFGVIAVLLKTALSSELPPLTITPAMIGAFVIVFVLDDFLYYLSHRLAHRVGCFWASHSVHHSSSRYNFFMGLRQPPTWMFTPAAVAPIVLILVGFPLLLVVLSGAVRALHHFLLHTERVRKLPAWIEFVFNTPSHHRVHHASTPDLLDRNYGGVLIIWDRLFGTFTPEPAGGVARYGVVDGASPANVVKVAAEPWRKLYRRVRMAPTWRAKAAAIIAPPHNLSLS